MGSVREDLIGALGGPAAVAAMSHEQRADALEEFEIAKLDAAAQAIKKDKTFPSVAELSERIDKRGYRRGAGSGRTGPHRGPPSRRDHATRHTCLRAWTS